MTRPKAKPIPARALTVYSGPGRQFTDCLMDALVRAHGDDPRRAQDDLTEHLTTAQRTC
jgi:hypothetical protein